MHFKLFGFSLTTTKYVANIFWFCTVLKMSLSGPSEDGPVLPASLQAALILTILQKHRLSTAEFSSHSHKQQIKKPALQRNTSALTL